MIKLVIIAALTFIISESHAQYNVLKADLLGPLRGKYGVAFERSFSPKWSARILAEFGTYGRSSFTPDDEYKISGNGIIPELRFFPVSPRKGAPAGLFIAAAFRSLRFRETYWDETQGVFFPIVSKGQMTNVGIDVGYQFTYRHFCAEILMGAGTGTMKKNDDIAASSMPYLSGNVLNDERKFYRAEILIGYMFPAMKKKE